MSGGLPGGRGRLGQQFVGQPPVPEIGQQGKGPVEVGRQGKGQFFLFLVLFFPTFSRCFPSACQKIFRRAGRKDGLAAATGKD